MRRSALSAAAALLLLTMQDASAFPVSHGARAESVREAGFVLAPLAYLRFCNRYKHECGQNSSNEVVALDGKSWSVIRAVNRAVNRAVRPKKDQGEDDWRLGRRSGDCDDYAVEKRHRLLRAGLPASALSLTEAAVGGVGHLVLTVRTDHGDFVLDNLREAVLPWQRIGYRFIKTQSAANPDFWVAIDDSASSMIVAEAELQN